MKGEPYWKVVVTNQITKSYDRWDEIDSNNNIINKGQDFNIKIDCKISNGDRVKECTFLNIFSYKIINLITFK